MSSVEKVKNICKQRNKSPITKLCKRIEGKRLTENTTIDDRFYSPLKYFLGLNDKEIEIRLEEINKGRKIDYRKKSSYKPFETDIGKTVKQSKYTKLFYSLYPEAVTLEAKSSVTGIPVDILKKVYDKGLAAWRTGR